MLREETEILRARVSWGIPTGVSNRKREALQAGVGFVRGESK